MANTVTIGARITEDLAEELQKLAEATGRSRSWLISDALKSYVRAERDFLAAVDEGLQDIEAGRTTAHEQIETEFRKRYRDRG